MLSILSFVVAVIGVIGLLFSLRQAYRARLRQFEEKYVERYWSILDDLSLDVLKVSDKSPDPDDEKIIRRYISLCEDELQLRSSGYISDATYYEWAAGMLEQFRQPMFKEVWSRVQGDGGQGMPGVFGYENLSRLIKYFAESDAWHINDLKRADPLRQPSIIRMFRGLKGIAGV